MSPFSIVQDFDFDMPKNISEMKDCHSLGPINELLLSEPALLGEALRLCRVSGAVTHLQSSDPVPVAVPHGQGRGAGSAGATARVRCRRKACGLQKPISSLGAQLERCEAASRAGVVGCFAFPAFPSI